MDQTRGEVEVGLPRVVGEAGPLGGGHRHGVDQLLRRPGVEDMGRVIVLDTLTVTRQGVVHARRLSGAAAVAAPITRPSPGPMTRDSPSPCRARADSDVLESSPGGG